MTRLAYKSPVTGSRDSFGQTVRSEWTKIRTVRGWLIGLLLAAVLPAGFAFLAQGHCAASTSGPNGKTVTTACPGPTIGPNGEAVEDDFYFVHQSLTGNGSLTVRLTSMTGLYLGPDDYNTGNGTAGWSSGLQPWSKAGILIKENTTQGSAYAAIMLTGSHGVRFQYNFLHDITGGGNSRAATVWLRLTRSGHTITGYSSSNGTDWSLVGSAALTGLSSTAQIGMFAASPDYAKPTSAHQGYTAPSQVTGVFDRVDLSGASGSWNGTAVGGGNTGSAVSTGADAWAQSGGAVTVQGAGDIAPDVGMASPDGSAGVPIDLSLVGTFVGLIALIVIAAMFMTSEYRRGLIRVTFAASPNRGRVLAAKALVIAAVTFVAALIGTTLAMAVSLHLLHSGGSQILPVPKLTIVRIVAGTAAAFAVVSVLILALAALLRRTAVVVVIGIVTFVLGWLLTRGGLLPTTVADWILRLTPAAAYAVQQAIPAYSFAPGNYTPANGFYPLAPWAGLLVICLWAAAALGLAIYVVNRRDA